MFLFTDEVLFENYLTVASVCVSGGVKVGETGLVTKWQRLKLSKVYLGIQSTILFLRMPEIFESINNQVFLSFHQFSSNG